MREVHEWRGSGQANGGQQPIGRQTCKREQAAERRHTGAQRMRTSVAGQPSRSRHLLTASRCQYVLAVPRSILSTALPVLLEAPVKVSKVAWYLNLPHHFTQLHPSKPAVTLQCSGAGSRPPSLESKRQRDSAGWQHTVNTRSGGWVQYQWAVYLDDVTVCLHAGSGICHLHGRDKKSSSRVRDLLS